MVKIKFVYKKSVRKFEIPEQNCHNHVRKIVAELVKDDQQKHPFVPLLQYKDDESDWITIQSAADLNMCLSCIKTPKIYVLRPNESREHAVQIKEEDQSWVRYGFHGSAPSSVSTERPAPARGDDLDEKVDDTQREGFLPMDWNLLVEDFLTANQAALQRVCADINKGLKQGKDLKSQVMAAISEQPFSQHPFIKNSRGDLEKMLSKINHYSMFLLNSPNGLEMALPHLARGYAKMKQGNGNVVDMMPVFQKMFPAWHQWLGQGVQNGQEVSFDLGAVLRHMMQPGASPTAPPVADEEEAEEAPAVVDGVSIHKGVTCDICNTKPIIGTRYKCLVCPDFDLCEGCRNKNDHPQEHPLIALQSPAPRNGFLLGQGHFKGAREVLKAPWMRCKGPRRRAFKKFCKGRRGQGDAEDGKKFCKGGRNKKFFKMKADEDENELEGFPEPGPRRHGGRHHRDRHKSNWDTPEDSDSSSSSSSSSSSEDDDFDMGMTPGDDRRGRRGHRHGGQSSNKRRLKKRLKKLKKREQKIGKRVKKMRKRQIKLGKRIGKMEHREFKVKAAVQKLAMKLQSIEEKDVDMHTNPPGHDPNPNPHRRPWEFRGMRDAADVMSALQFGPSHGPRGPHGFRRGPPCAGRRLLVNDEDHVQRPAPPAPSQPMETDEDFKYGRELQLLSEMGFTPAAFDEKTCKRLLNETKGNLKEVVFLLSGASQVNAGNEFHRE